MRMRWTVLLVVLGSLGPLGPLGAQSGMRTFATDAELHAYLDSLTPRPTKSRWDLQRGRKGAGLRCRNIGPIIHRGRRLGTTDQRPADAVVVGHVRSDRGPLGGGNVAIRTLGTSTNVDSAGAYRFLLRGDGRRWPRFASVVARMIGYAPQSANVVVNAGDSITVNFDLCFDGFRLSEIVVSGSAGYAAASGFSGESAFALNSLASADNIDAVRGRGSSSITNLQEAQVDEGGIVKVHGEHLVILRRGRLFTVHIGDAALTPVAMLDAYAPGLNPRGAWYDEMLIYEDRVFVLGYSYARGGTEINVFRVDSAGGLSYGATYHFRSNDYYSSRNYAARVADGNLILYTPLRLGRLGKDLNAVMPAMRVWRGELNDSGFAVTSSPTRVFAPRGALRRRGDTALHTVTTCALVTEPLVCSSTIVVGPPGSVHYVSPKAVYIGTVSWRETVEQDPSAGRPGMLFRIPLGVGTPKAIRIAGSPIDQFSMREEPDGRLHVLVDEAGHGQGMFHGEDDRERLNLLTVPPGRWGDGSKQLAATQYRRLPAPKRGTLVNRFVGDHLLYGVGDGWRRFSGITESALQVVPLDGTPAVALRLGHSIERIDLLGTGAIAIGSAGAALHFTGLALGREPRVRAVFVIDSARQGETRSHGFFYRVDAAGGGVIGLPVASTTRFGWSQLMRPSARVLFVRDDGSDFRDYGALVVAKQRQRDACRVSCVDWYGNSRPIFLGERVFALLGYELIEGRELNGRIAELRRVSVLTRPAGRPLRP